MTMYTRLLPPFHPCVTVAMHTQMHYILCIPRECTPTGVYICSITYLHINLFLLPMSYGISIARAHPGGVYVPKLPEHARGI